MEHGHVVPLSEFLQGIPDLEQVDSHVLDLTSIPTRRDIEDVCRQVQSGKAMGLDRIPPELFKAAPKEMTDLYYDLYLKILQEAYKQSGCPSKPESHRSLYLASQPGKLLQKALRKKIGPTLQQTLHPLHCGPKTGAPVTLPAMAVHRINKLFRAKNVFRGIFCLDTKSAYYRIIRQLAVGKLDTEEGAVRILQEFGLEPCDYREFRTPPALPGNGKGHVPTDLVRDNLLARGFCLLGYCRIETGGIMGGCAFWLCL